MKINYMSDLHLEWGSKNPDFIGGDVLLLAGDIINLVAMKQLAHRLTNLESEARSFFQQAQEKYSKIYMVLGNHEHFNGDINTTLELEREFLKPFPSVQILHNEWRDLKPGWRIWGGTFWTDYNDGSPELVRVARIGMMDHHLIRRGEMFFSPEDAWQLNKEARESLSGCLTEGYKYVVMSHHTPSMVCCQSKWGNNPLNYAFHNTRLESLLSNPSMQHWVAGHTHDGFEGLIENAWVHINPRGYPRPRNTYENEKFDSTRQFEI